MEGNRKPYTESVKTWSDLPLTSLMGHIGVIKSQILCFWPSSPLIAFRDFKCIGGYCTIMCLSGLFADDNIFDSILFAFFPPYFFRSLKLKYLLIFSLLGCSVLFSKIFLCHQHLCCMAYRDYFFIQFCGIGGVICRHTLYSGQHLTNGLSDLIQIWHGNVTGPEDVL